MIHIKRQYWFSLILVILIICHTLYIYNKVGKRNFGHKVVVCIPVYGQSYALGEEAKRITDFDSLRIKYNGRIVTENLDYRFGYFDYSDARVALRRLLQIHNKSFELSVYSMAETLVDRLGKDTLICIFPGGQGLTDIAGMSKGTIPYYRFLKNINKAYTNSKKRHWEFVIPAICWMQGESDIADYPGTDYKKLLQQFSRDINLDIKRITRQKENVQIVCYQTSTITKGMRYIENNYDGSESFPPQAQMELVRDDSLFWASGPTYPYSFVREDLHIDAGSQRYHGKLASRSVLDILRKGHRFQGLVPLSPNIDGTIISLSMIVPQSPLLFDTMAVKKAPHYGFSVINKDNTDIIDDVLIHNDTLIISCVKSPIGCKLRYGINGEFMKSGRRIGPRGNLRDSQSPYPNWCYFFDICL